MAIIGLDATYLSVCGKGVSRFQHNLIKALAKNDAKNHYHVFLNKRNILPELPSNDNIQYIRMSIPSRIIWDQFQLPFIIKKYKLGIYFSLLDTLPVIGVGKFVMFLFEMPDYRIGPTHYSGIKGLYSKISNGYNKFLFRPSLKKADIIITSSYSTKSDIVGQYGINADKIRVLYPAADDCFQPAKNERILLETKKRYGTEAGYVFHISSSDSRDNTPAVIRAYHKALKESKFYQKLLIGGDVGLKSKELEKLITELNLKDRIILTGRLSEKDLVAVYQAADLFVDPSLYEGFGLQVVEAMSCGIPVVVSNVTSLPEIVGDAGILVSPTDIDALASALARVITDVELRELMRRKGLERAKYFSWDKLARETIAIYDGLSENL
jgi:glycosyltransferase involved in cell wall biosynthesis